MYYECIVYVLLQYTCTMYSHQTVCRDNKNIEIKLLKLHTAVTIKHPVKQFHIRAKVDWEMLPVAKNNDMFTTGFG